MKSIHVKLKYEDPKLITVSQSTGVALRKAIKSSFPKLKNTDLRKIKFKGFKNGTLGDDFYARHSSEANALVVDFNNQISNPIPFTFQAYGKLLQLSRNLKVSPTIYIRDCYSQIWNSFLAYEKQQIQLSINHPERVAHAYLSGTPGIGKTAFLPYLIDIMLKEKRQVIFGSRDMDGFMYFKTISNCEWIKEDDIGGYLQNENIFFLMDSKHVKNTLGPCLICSSPRSDIAYQYRKTAFTLYMPVWEWQEIEKLHDAVYSDILSRDRLAARFHLLGGVPRYLFDHLNDLAVGILHNAVNNCDLSHLKRLYESNGAYGEEISHRLVHLTSSEWIDPPFAKHTLYYASDYVTTLIAEKYSQFRRDSVVQWLDETSDLGIAGGLRGNLFENIGHLQLKQGGHFKCRELEYGNETSLKLRPLQINVVGKDSLVPTVWSSDIYYKPLSKTFECIDSWTVINGELWGFQFTVSSKHKISSALYWYYEHWNLKHYVTVVYDVNKLININKQI